MTPGLTDNLAAWRELLDAVVDLDALNLPPVVARPQPRYSDLGRPEIHLQLGDVLDATDRLAALRIWQQRIAQWSRSELRARYAPKGVAPHIGRPAFVDVDLRIPRGAGHVVVWSHLDASTRKLLGLPLRPADGIHRWHVIDALVADLAISALRPDERSAP